MKGLLLTLFQRFAEDEFGHEVGRALGLVRHAPPDTREVRELSALAARLASVTGSAPAEILCRFGVVLFPYLAHMYPVFVAGADSALTFLSRTETSVHGELRKLYPAAQFPHFDVTQPAADRLEMVYRSPCQLADLAEGLIRGCGAYFGEAVDVRRESLPAAPGVQTVRFVLVRLPAAASAEGSPAPQGPTSLGPLSRLVSSVGAGGPRRPR